MREFFMEEFENKNTCILICTDAAGMEVNIRDVAPAIQWKIPDHLVFASLLQRIGRAGRDRTLPTVSIVFIESKHILPDDISFVKDSPFRNYTTAIGLYDNVQAAKIISTFYKNNF